MPGFEIFGDEERQEVQEVLETGVLFRYAFDDARKGRWKAKTFEEEFARRLNVEHCLLVSSGTSALCTALAAAGIGAGDEVIVPPFTFVATFAAVLLGPNVVGLGVAIGGYRLDQFLDAVEDVKVDFKKPGPGSSEEEEDGPNAAIAEYGRSRMDDPVRMYLRQMGQIPLLKRAEEIGRDLQ